MKNPRQAVARPSGCIPPWRISCALSALLALAASGDGSSVAMGATAAAATTAAPANALTAAATTRSTTAPTTASTTAMTAAEAPPLVGAADAARLLDQTTFGVTASDVAHVQSVGVAAYITEQLAYPPSQYTGYVYTPHTAPEGCKGDSSSPPDASSLCARNQYSPFQVQREFFVHALNNPDQLRQRVAFALSQIMVVSSVEIYEAYGLAAYQNLLLKDAFGNYRTLLQDVTLSPTMGHYLDMADSDATNPQNGTVPNQNYAREVMQLFSIGLVELNPDGTRQLDSSGAPIPTFDGATIEGFAAVFTGWTYPPLPGANSKWTNPINLAGTMVAVPAHHQSGTKALLDGYTVPANQAPTQDLGNALDNIFNHPNVGPFISHQLIQHLVTSNPTPAYVARISAVFANNGHGVRGDLGAVVRAILTDTEARGAAPPDAAFGRLRDPALFITSTLRSLGGKSDGVLLRNASSAMGQPMFSAATVFSFYPPNYQIAGTQTVAPQFGIENAATALARANFINTIIMQGGAAPDPTVSGGTGTSINLTHFAGAANNSAMIAELNQALMHGSLPSDASNTILAAANSVGVSSSNPLAAARTASYLMLTSSQYQVVR
jgi:uncharacterized protein (DUF1800 family)